MRFPWTAPQRNISIFAEEANCIFTSEGAKIAQKAGYKRVGQGEESNFSQTQMKERRVYMMPIKEVRLMIIGLKMV